jgi:hypothetical protein
MSTFHYRSIDEVTDLSSVEGAPSVDSTLVGPVGMPYGPPWGMIPIGWIYLGSVWCYGNYHKAVAKTLDNWLFPIANGYMLFLDLPRDLNQQTINLRFRGTDLPNSGVVYSASATTRKELDAHIMHIQELVLHSPDELKAMLALSGVCPSKRSELGRFIEARQTGFETGRSRVVALGSEATNCSGDVVR